MVLIPEIRSIDFSIPISSVSSILFLVEPKRTGYLCTEKKIHVRDKYGKKGVCIQAMRIKNSIEIFFLLPLSVDADFV
jgi:hypothetical protein